MAPRFDLFDALHRRGTVRAPSERPVAPRGRRAGESGAVPPPAAPPSSTPRGRRMGESGAVTTEFVLLYGALLALVMSVIHFGLVFNAALAVTDAADAVLETAQSAGAADFSALAVAKAVVGDERIVRDLAVEVQKERGEVTVSVSAAAPRIVVGLPTAVSHRTQGPVERFIPEGRR